MESNQIRIIRSKEQYYNYCDRLENFVLEDNPSRQDEIELLTLVIGKWDNDNISIPELSPVELIKVLMSEHRLKSSDLAEIVGLSKGTVSKILNYHKGLSKESIRKLSEHFKVSQEALNRPYTLAPENIQQPVVISTYQKAKKVSVYTH